MQMNSSEEAPNTQKDYLPERDKLFSELFSQFGSQSLETEKPAQAHSPEEEQGLTGLFGNYLSRKGGDGKSSQRKDTSTTDAAADEELILIRTRAAKYWVGVTVLVLLGLFLFLHSIITFLRSPDAIMSISCSLLGTGLCFLAAIIVVKTLRICLQSWSLLRQGRFIAIYLIAFIMAPRFSETFTLLGLVLVGLQVVCFIALFNTLSPRGTTWKDLIKTPLKNMLLKVRRKSPNNPTNPKTPGENSFLPL